MKICSLYGAGFYYVPGTDICLKIGGYVRAQQSYNANGSQTNGPLVANENSRGTVDMAWRSRAYITADARQQTAYGTVRSYVSVGLSGDQAIAFSANRAFIQFAGFTVGTAVSFYDFYSSPSVSYFGGKIQPASDTGDAGQFVTAYTAQFGNGFSATISAEQPQQNRAQGVFNTGFATAAANLAATPLATPANSGIGTKVPDFVANLRIDQAWGSAQLMGALHDASATYYGANDLGHPGNKWGYAIGAGLRLNAPMFGPGDYFQTQVNYSNGAIGYNIAGSAFRYGAYGGDGKYGMGLALDGVYGGTAATGGDIQLTKAWSVNASYEHFWNANWQTSLYGVYVNTKYNDAATGLLCTNFSTGAAFAGNAAACNTSGAFNWNYWAVGSRTQWNVNKNFYMGVDVVYSKLDQNMNAGNVFLGGASATRPLGTYTTSDMSAWTAQFRVHRDFGF